MRRWFSFLSLALFAAALVSLSNEMSLALSQEEDKGGPAKPGVFNTVDLAFVNKFLSPGQYMTTAEIKPGMTGYGLSVFQGSKVERFNVKVIGVIKKVLNGRDAILVRLSGAPMGASTVIKGMSGSPVYIDGKLIGAVSFGYEFSKEPIAGLTPIVDMLDALAPDTPIKGRIAHQPAQSWAYQAGPRTGAAGGAPRMVPLMSPIGLAGFSPRAEAFLAERFKDFGMSVTSGAAGGMDGGLAAGSPPSIHPGSAVSVLLTTGDFTTVATGTATARFGKRVIGFGHPFLQAGSVDFPMATAYIHDVLPSLFVSAKVSSPIAVIGAITADRPWSIGGQMGKSAKMIPVSFNVVDETRRIKRSYKCQVVDHPDLTPELLAGTAMSAIDATHQSSGPYVARVESTIEAEGIEPIVRVDRFSTNFTPHALASDSGKFRFVADPVGSYLLKTAAQIVDNDFQKASIKSAKLDIVLEDGHQTATLEKVYVDKAFAAPGETVKVSYVLRPYDKQAFTDSLSFTVPRDIPDGNLLIGIASGDELNAVRKRMGLVDPTPETLKQIADKIVEKERGDAVALVAALPEQSLVVKGVKITNPPAHWNRIFFSNRHTKGPSLVKGEVRTSKLTEWLVDGSHILTIEVRSPEKVLARQAPYAISAPGADESITTTEQAKKAIEAFRKNQSAAASTTAASDKPAAPAPQAGSASDYPHMRPLSVWRQTSEEDFRAGKNEGTTVDSWGRMSPGFNEIAFRYLPSVMQIWSGTWARGCFYFATAGEIFKWRGDSQAPEPVAKLAGIAIPAMTSDSKGTVYAASIPGGKLFALDSTDKLKEVAKLSEPIITSLVADDKDNIYIGTAGTGKVYKLDASGHLSTYFTCGQAHVLCLHFSGLDKKLYIGTGEKGVVYAIDETGKPQAVYQSGDHLITGVARDKRGDLYIASAGQGHLVRVLPNSEEQVLATSEAFYTLHYDPSTDSVFSGDAEGDITHARLDAVSGQPYFFPVCHTEQEAVLALASDGNKRLFAGASNLGMVRAFDMKPATTPIYNSPVKDAGKSAQWSRIRTLGAFNEPNEQIHKEVIVETRVGDTGRPDETWSAWKTAQYNEGAFVVTSPAARYLQYRLTWKQPEGAAKPAWPASIGQVETSYLPRDSAPKLSTLSVKAAANVSGKQDVSITASDPDGDNMLLTVEISADGAQTWKPIVTDLRSKKTASKSSVKAGDAIPLDKLGVGKDASEVKDEVREPLKGGVQENADDDKKDSTSERSPSARLDDKPDENGKDKDKDKDKEKDSDDKDKKADKDSDKAKGKERDKPKSKSPHETSAAKGSAAASTTADTTESFAFIWDTAKHKDGNYIVKFVLDDRLSSPADNQKTNVLRSVTVDNSAPEVELSESGRGADQLLHFKVTVKDKHTPLANVTYKLDDGEAFALSCLSGGADGLSGQFGITGLKASSGSHKLEVKVSDAAGNSSTKTFTTK